jgi:hypothetical protein
VCGCVLALGCPPPAPPPLWQADLNIVNAEVIRSNPTGLCEAGLCANGPQAAWGYTWSFTLVSEEFIVVPTSPTDHSPDLTTTIDPVLPVLADVNVVSSVLGVNAVRLRWRPVPTTPRTCGVAGGYPVHAVEERLRVCACFVA